MKRAGIFSGLKSSINLNHEVNALIDNGPVPVAQKRARTFMNWIDDPLKAARIKSKMNQLEAITVGTLLSAHTKWFLSVIDDSTLLSVMDDDLSLFLSNEEKKSFSQDVLTECHLLCAFFGAKEIFNYLVVKHHLKITPEIFNMALLSGKYMDEDLDALAKVAEPTFNSLRYAIHSKSAAVVKQVFDKYHLRPEPQHLVTAASLGAADIFDLIIDQGISPAGHLVYEAAKYSENEYILEKLRTQFDYRDDDWRPH